MRKQDSADCVRVIHTVLTRATETDSLKGTVTSTARASTWRFAVSQALIVLTAWLSIAPALHGAGHDQDCDPAILLHDASQHRLSAEPSGQHDHVGDHCVACHLFRNSRQVASSRFVPQTVGGSGLAVHVHGGAVVVRIAVPLPARAPPALV